MPISIFWQDEKVNFKISSAQFQNVVCCNFKMSSAAILLYASKDLKFRIMLTTEALSILNSTFNIVIFQ